MATKGRTTDTLPKKISSSENQIERRHMHFTPKQKTDLIYYAERLDSSIL
jgi:hypothetical protein